MARRSPRIARRGAWRSVALVALAALAGRASALPEHEGGPPSGQTGPGDPLRPANGALTAPPVRGTPLVGEPTAVGDGGQASLLEALAATTGADASGLAPAGALDGLIDPALSLSLSPRGAGGVSAFPIPFISYSLNEGPTGGAVVPIWLTNGDGDIDALVTPIASYNKIFGFEAGAHVGVYSNSLVIGAGAVVSSKVARNIYFEAYDPAALGTPMAFEVFTKNEVDPASRFYGFGAGTTDADVSNDTHRETVWRLGAGLTVAPGLQVFWRQRFRDVHVGGGRVPGLPSTPQVYPDAPGIPGATIWGTGAEVRYTRLDSLFLPRRGIFAALVLEGNFGLGGDTSGFYPRVVADVRGFFTPFDGPVTLGVRVRGEWLSGSRVPFYEQAILGGRNSLRAFGEDRFTDLASALFQIEARITVLDVHLFGSRVLFQVVPFFDEGRVFHSWKGSFRGDWQWSPGCGFRLAVPPSVVARVDVAYGSEGANVFAGLGLPF